MLFDYQPDRKAKRPADFLQGFKGYLHTDGYLERYLGQWKSLENYLLDGRLEISNNRAENSTRPFTAGRKNWLFADTPKGAKASAILYSIIETAKQNDLDPYRYLEYIFTAAPNCDLSDPKAVEALLPNMAPKDCQNEPCRPHLTI